MGKEIFSTRLREVRMQTGKTQKEFADMVESTAATISAYENATKNPSLEIVINIAQKCNVSINWLCGLSNKKKLNSEFNNLKDIALKILEIININTVEESFTLKTYEVDIHQDLSGNTLCKYEQAIKLPKIKELSNFFEAYEELNKLYQKGGIKHQIIDTWLDGALEELAAIPVYTELPYEDIPDATPQG